MLKLLEPSLSSARIGTYILAAGHDDARALKLYEWNAQLGEAFHLPIQSVEIALRNRINAVLIASFGADWWDDATFLALVEPRQSDAIREVRARISKRGQAVVTGQIVAGLSFGFWVAMLDARYNPRIWSHSLAIGFPDLPPTKTRDDLQKMSRQIANFRNRIWHHEPIFKANITAEYSRCMETLAWLCPHKHKWIRPQCRVMAVLRARP
ncbi:hypothetical protein MCELHM10_00369 [Paracoccaceae bacterium]